MFDNKVWSRVDCLPTGVRAIPDIWIFAKRDDGRCKARVVTLENKPVRREAADYLAPVAALTTLRMLVSKALHHGYHLH